MRASLSLEKSTSQARVGIFMWVIVVTSSMKAIMAIIDIIFYTLLEIRLGMQPAFFKGIWIVIHGLCGLSTQAHSLSSPVELHCLTFAVVIGTRESHRSFSSESPDKSL